MIEIGSVKIDIHSSERQFEFITFSDIDCIKGLIKHRSKLDPYFQMSEDNYFDNANIVKPMNQEIVSIYADLERLISRANINIKQKFIINKLMEGYSEKEIADMYGQTQQNISSNFDKSCKKIKQLYDLDWKYNYIFVNHMKVTWSYKQCSRCHEYKPLLNEFFSLNQRSPDGFNTVCKTCR